MLPLSDVVNFGKSRKTHVKIVKPWWDVITDYLLKFLLIISLLVGGLELTSGSFDCLPTIHCKLPKNRTLLSGVNYHNACTIFYYSRKALDVKAATVAAELKKYPLHYAKYVNSQCSKTATHWFASYFPLCLFGQALILLTLDNFWLTFPLTASVIETFSLLVIECYESPGTSFCLPQFIDSDRNQNGDNSMDEEQTSNELGTLISISSENKPLYNSGLSSWSFNQRREGKISFDIATAVRVNSLYEKVQRFKERIKSSRRIWILYVVQTVIQAVLTMLFLILNSVLMKNLKGTIKCSVNSVFIPVMHDHFTCTHNLQDVFEKTLRYLFLPLLGLCFCIFTIVSGWTLWNSQCHSRNNSELDDYIANLHKSEKDTKFLLQLLKAYDRQYAEQFHSYMKEDFYKKWKAHILKLKWPSSKLEKLCEDHTNECKRLALTALLGIPETLFALNRLNKLELKLISELENDDFQQFKKLENLIDLALIECNLNEIPQTIFDMSWLKVLTLKYNLISTIGDAIRKLENLTSLNLSHNKLVSIDRSLKDLRNLHILDLSENPDLEMTTIKTALACETLQDLKLSKSTEKKLDNNDLEKFLRLSGIKTSIKHKERFGKLRKHLPEKLCKIGKFRADFNAEFIIGRGCGATAVYIGLSDDGTEVAVKRMLTYTLKDKAKIKKRMSNLMNIEESPHIVKYYHFQLGEPFSYSVFQLCEQTLEEYVDLVRKTRRTDLQEKLNKQAPTMIREILAGLLAIHGTGREKRILHMNLKPSNIFVDVDGHVRLANFGISMRLCKDSSIHNNEEECTLHWRAVESQTTEDKPNRKVKYTKKSDIQVAGMLSYYILREGDHPFGEKSVRVRNLIDGNPVDLDKLSNPAAKDLISWMLQKKSKNRPLAEEALKHPYIQDRDQQFLMLIYFSCEQEIDRNDLKCDVVKELNDDSMLNNLRWKSEIDSEVHNQMETSRYDDSASALVRFIRTASEHSWTQNVRDDPARYFLDKFPVLPLVVHRIIRKRQDWRERPQLKIFFTSEK